MNTEFAIGSRAGSPISSVAPLTFLARLAQGAISPDTMPSLSFQLASAISQFGSFLRIRGDEHLEHYYGAALSLTCLEPRQTDVRVFEAALLLFLRFDRRSPNLPSLVAAGHLRVQCASSIHFIQSLHDQTAFQAIYAAAAQLDRYGPGWNSPRKLERVILLSREVSGRSLVAPLTPVEQRFIALGSS